MIFDIIDPVELLTDNLFFEDQFLAKVKEYEWNKFQEKKVLVRGCSSSIIPPWAFMIITSRLQPFAASIRYGNEHDNILVYRKLKD